MDYSSKLIKMSGREYLEVKWRLVWFREEHPNGGVMTRAHSITADEAVIHASVHDAEGNILGEGYGWCDKKSGKMGRYVEKAETAAIGRALGVAGYGTQFMGDELEEGDHLADSPVEKVTPLTTEELHKIIDSMAEQLASEEEKKDAETRLDAKGVTYLVKGLKGLFPDEAVMEAFCELTVGIPKPINMSKKHARVLAWFGKRDDAAKAVAAFMEEMKDEDKG